MTDSNVLYTSQSATSTYQECPRKRWFNNHLQGRGIQLVDKHVPLTTGNCVHAGTQWIGENYANQCYVEHPEHLIQNAVFRAKLTYTKELELVDLANVPDAEQEQTKAEQLALTEVLVRLWYAKEWPKIQQYYHILAVEQEIAIEVAPGIIYQSKPDFILIHKESGELVNYSLKTLKTVTERDENNYYTGNQTYTEPYFTKLWLEDIREIAQGIGGMLGRFPKSNLHKLNKMIPAVGKVMDNIANLPAHPSALRFCFLVKGQRHEKHKGQKDYWTDNPFLYGYRKFGAADIDYAWANKIIKPENKSGYGLLGKGWEQFQIFGQQGQGELTLEQWFDMVMEGGLQQEIGNPADEYILSQPEINVNHHLCEVRVGQLIQIEKGIQDSLQMVEAYGGQDHALDTYFPFNTGSCYYPTPCDFRFICPNGGRDYKHHIAVDPTNPEFGPMYKLRVPHHATEVRALTEQEKGKGE